MRDLNSRPSRCKRAALPTELIAHIFVGTIVPNFSKKTRAADRQRSAARCLPTEAGLSTA